MLHLLHMQTNTNDDTAGLSSTPCLDLKPLLIPILIFRFPLYHHRHQHQHHRQRQRKEKQEKEQGRRRRHPVPRPAGTRRPSRGPGHVPGLRRAHGAGPGVDGVRGDALRVHGGAVALAVRADAAAGGGRVGPGDGPGGRMGSAGAETRAGEAIGCGYSCWYGDGDGGEERARAGAVQGGRLAGGAAARKGAGGRLRGGAAGVEGARRCHGPAGGDEDGDEGGEGGAGEERAAHGVRVLPGRGGDGEPDALEREGRGGGARGVGGGGEAPCG